MSVNCVYCGHVNPDGSTVCLSCGRTLPPAPGGASSYGQQQPQAPSWGQPPSNQPPPPPSYPPPPPSYPPPATNPYGSSYPPPAPPQDPNAWQGGYGGQPSSFGNQPPGQPAPPPSFGNPQQPSYGASSYPPPAPAPSFGQPPAVWGGQPQAYGAPTADAQTGKQMAMIGMAVGILGALVGWCCYSGFLFGPAALVLGFIARSKLSSSGSQDGNGMAMTAIGLGALATVEPIVWLIFWLIVAGSLNAIS